jgi:hypothetical protein
MTQVRIRGRDATTFIGEEAVAFGTTAATMLPAFPVTTDESGGIDTSGLTTAENDVEDESVYLQDNKTTVQGLQSGPVKGYNIAFRPNTTQWASGVAVTDDYVGAALRMALGAEYPAVGATNGGDVLSAAAQTTTAVTVTTSGARFTIGEWVGVQTSLGLEFAQVINIAANVLTLNPALVGSPVATTGKVYGCKTWAPVQDNTRSATIQHAKAMNANYQYTANGCALNLAGLSLEIGKIPILSFDIESAAHTGPSAQSIATTVQTNPCAAPIAVRGSTVLFQASSATALRTSQYTLEAFAPKFMPLMGHAPGMGNDVQGKVACEVLGTRTLATIDLTLAADTAQFTNWSAQTDMMFLLLNTVGSGITRRATGLYVPTAQIVGEPKITVKGKRVIVDLTIRPRMNTTCTTSGLTSTADYFARAPYYLFAG